MKKLSIPVYGKSIQSIFAILMLVLIQGFCNSLVAQTVTEKGTITSVQKIIDNGYFKYEVTGNAVRDMESYKIAKQFFIQKYPEKYKEMQGGVNQVSKHLIDKIEFEKMPAAKVNEILSHPEKYQIQ